MQMTGRNLENMESRRKDSDDVPTSQVHILSAAVTGFSAVPA